MIVNCWNIKNCSIWYSCSIIQYNTWWSCTNTHIDWYITLLSHNIHIKYVVKKFRLLSVYMLYTYKTIWHYTTYNIKLLSFKNTYILYEHNVMFFYCTQINCIITTQVSKKLSLCTCLYITMYRHWIIQSLLCTTMWMCTYQHCQERRKR